MQTWAGRASSDYLAIVSYDPATALAKIQKIDYEGVRLRPQSQLSSLQIGDTVEQLMEVSHGEKRRIQQNYSYAIVQ